MHPHLSDKRIACREFIQALESCHAAGWTRFTGHCNGQKDALSRCLHAESVKRATANREGSKVRKEKLEKATQEFYTDD